MRGDRLAQGEEPDRGFVLLAILAVERLEDFLGRFRRAEQFFQVRDDRLVERDIELGSAEEFVEMRSDRLIETQEIDRWLVFRFVLPIQRCRHISNWSGGAEQTLDFGADWFQRAHRFQDFIHLLSDLVLFFLSGGFAWAFGVGLVSGYLKSAGFEFVGAGVAEAGTVEASESTTNSECGLGAG